MAARKDYQNRKADSPFAEAAIGKEVILTVGGKPIPPDVAHLIPYGNTDQGIAEAAAAKVASGKVDPTLPRISVGDGPFEKSLQQHAESIQPWEVTDPIAVAKRRVPDAEHKHFHLFKGGEGTNQHAIDAGFVIERDKDGREIKIASMVMGSMPLSKWEQRERFFADEAADAYKAEVETYMENQNKLARDGGDSFSGGDASNPHTPERRIGNAGEILTGV
jgi:antitoxin (DNA-binding transcriptional repressor) of toxin-antitoxin stability system